MDPPQTISCALCLSNENESKLLNIKNDEFSMFRTKFKSIFRIEINPSILLWQYICNNCIDKIEEFYEFFKKVSKNCWQLKRSLKTVSSNTEIVSIKNAVNQKQTTSSPKISQSTYNISILDRTINEEVDEESIIIKLELDETLSNENHEINKNITECVLFEVEDDISENKTNFCNREAEKEELCENSSSKQEKNLRIRTPKKVCDAKIRSFMDLICELCNTKQNFSTFKEMQSHYQEEHNTKGFIRCCGKKIFRKDRAMDHITLHMNPDAFKCQECGQRSKSRVLLRIHMKQHLPVEERPFQCDICDQRFVLKSQLHNHQATHLSADEKKYICDECGKAFALKFVLMKHKVTHTPEKPYFCEVCAKTFSCKGNLNSHVRTHVKEPEPRVQCADCGHWYKNEQTLRSHSHRHRDTRDHVCKICSKKCASQSSLLQHIRYVHQKISKYECNICQKQFRRRPELTEHVARHTGEILYTCQFCPKTFFSSSNYFAHRKTKHAEQFTSAKKDVKS